MSSFPIPTCERARLRALTRSGAMDAAADKLTQSMALAAASIANAPIGALTLVGAEFVRCKAIFGLAEDDVARGDSICAHTVSSKEPLVVSDLLADPRFASNPFVTDGPRVRFYAGFPLLVNGQSIGALCVLDVCPRTLSDDVLGRLAVLADGAAAFIALRARGDA